MPERFKKWITKNKDGWFDAGVSLIVVLIFMIIMSLCYDYYFDLNDDVLMKDILSGTYFGKSLGHDIQMHYPISFLVALCYRITDKISWYGLLLLRLQCGALFVIVDRTLSLISGSDKKIKLIKIALATGETLLLGSLMLPHLMNVQYTITVGFMGAAAVSLIMTAKESDNPVTFIKNCISPILIVFLGYMIRSEMMLLMMPYVCAAGVFKWSFEKKFFTKKNFIKYIAVLGVMAGLMLAAEGANRIAYSSDEWSEFTSLFNARTELYDYQVPPLYEDGNEEFYESIGISEEEAILFKNYNFGIDNEIDSEIMWKVADYAGSLNTETRTFKEKFAEKLKLYIYEFTHITKTSGTDYPWNIVVMALYLMCLILLIASRDYIGIWRIVALFAGRSAIWLYMLMGERTPDRITHSNYFIEITLLIFLVGMLLKRHLGAGKRAAAICAFIAGGLTIFSIFILKDSCSALRYDQDIRKDTNADYIALYEYMEDNEDDFYFMDTYSSVSYSERLIYSESKIVKKNSVTLGGWSAFSPIEADKLKEYGYEDMESGLLSDNAYFVKDKDISMDWLVPYYASHGTDIEVELMDIIGRFEIYKLRKLS